MRVGQEPKVEKIDPIAELKKKYKCKAVILTILMSLALIILFTITCFIDIAPGIPLAVVIVFVSIPCFFKTLANAFYDWLIEDFTISEELKKK